MLGNSSSVIYSNLPQSRETSIVHSVSQLSDQSRITSFKVLQLMEQKFEFESRSLLFQSLLYTGLVQWSKRSQPKVVAPVCLF